MASDDCNVCHAPLGMPIYRSAENRSLTSLCRIYPATTEVFSCDVCGHLQTRAIANVDDFYDYDYDILTDSEEEDQIYEVRDGQRIYRTAHQVSVFLEKIDLSHPLDLLDYGCAKSSTIRTLVQVAPSVTPFLYDVSDRYIPFWTKFAVPQNWAIKHTPRDWQLRFGVVTSFFSLEHIPTVTETMREIVALLRPGGFFYAVMPNVMTNVADFIVVDHCNHFTAPSLTRLLADAGLVDICIDATAHRGAFVVTARKPGNAIAPVRPGIVDPRDVTASCAETRRIAEYWRNAKDRLLEFERSLQGDKIAIYGAGFYGAFLRATLSVPENVVCHLDNNPFLQDKPFNGRPVLSPAQLPDDVHAVLVGLNPAHARAIVAEVPSLARPGLKLFYL